MRFVPLPVVLPLFVAAALAGVGARLPRRVPTLVALTTSLAVAFLCGRFAWASSTSTLVSWMGGWTPRGNIAVGIAFAVDPAGAGLATLAAALTAAAFVFGLQRFDEIHALFDALMLVFLAALVAFFFTGDLFDLFVFFELMSAAAYALCAYKSDEIGPLQGALNFAVLNTVGAFFTLFGLALLYGRTGALNFAQLQRALEARPDALVVASFWLLVSGFLVKAAVFPFHMWLDDAHAVAPTPASVMFSGIMVTAGLYAVARVFWAVYAPVLAPATTTVRAILLALGGLTAVVGAAMCWAQRHLKRLLAFSTIAHVGVMTLGIGCLSAEGAAGAGLYAIGHGLVKGTLFVLAGVILHTSGSVDEIALRGRGPAAGRVPWLLASLGLIGLPPFGTYAGHEAIVRSASEQGASWVSAVAFFVSALTGAAVLRVGGRVFLGWGPAVPEVQEEGGETSVEPETEGPRQISPPMIVSAAVLLAIAAVTGGSRRLTDATFAAAARFVDTARYAAEVLDGATPAVTFRVPRNAVDVLPPLLAAACATTLALATLFRERLPRSTREPIRVVVDAIYGPLRRLHSGHIADYVTWAVLGVAVIGLAAELAIAFGHR
jgi:multicomponent Na+:H+ antiporter subunit D